MNPDQNNEMAELMDNVAPELLEFIRTHINSFIQWDLLRFFYNNPHTIDTTTQVARYIGRDPRIVEPELEQLVRTGIIRKETLQELEIYTITEDIPLRDQLKQFMEACEDRQFRLKAIYHVIRGLRS